MERKKEKETSHPEIGPRSEDRWTSPSSVCDRQVLQVKGRLHVKLFPISTSLIKKREHSQRYRFSDRLVHKLISKTPRYCGTEAVTTIVGTAVLGSLMVAHSGGVRLHFTKTLRPLPRGTRKPRPITLLELMFWEMPVSPPSSTRVSQ
jgi:hypothetical protein